MNVVKSEVKIGFEPMNTCFADTPLKPLGYLTLFNFFFLEDFSDYYNYEDKDDYWDK
jgi:hypothetical protein